MIIINCGAYLMGKQMMIQVMLYNKDTKKSKVVWSQCVDQYPYLLVEKMNIADGIACSQAMALEFAGVEFDYNTFQESQYYHDMVYARDDRVLVNGLGVTAFPL